MASNIKNIKKLQSAINHFQDSFKILYTTSQFYSVRSDASITKYCIRKAVIDTDTKKSTSEEIFSTYSQLQVILYLRDIWYLLNNIELPTDNEIWNNIKLENKIDYKDVIT